LCDVHLLASATVRPLPPPAGEGALVTF
jgi:hypothetical protein